MSERVFKIFETTFKINVRKHCVITNMCVRKKGACLMLLFVVLLHLSLFYVLFVSNHVRKVLTQGRTLHNLLKCFRNIKHTNLEGIGRRPLLVALLSLLLPHSRTLTESTIQGDIDSW